jgi:hypothetical protein
MGQAKPAKVVQVVEAQRFVVRDTRGKTRAELGFRDGGPSLALFDEKGDRRTRLLDRG